MRLSPISMPGTFSPPHEAPTLQPLPAPETYFLFRACGLVVCAPHCTCIEVRTTYGSHFSPSTLRVPCVMLSRFIHTAVRIRTPLAVEGELAPIVQKHILLTIHLSIDTWVVFSSLSYCEERCGERGSALIYF